MSGISQSDWVMPDTNIRHLTERGLFAAIILAGFCSNPNRNESFWHDADCAVKQADVLIERLAKAK